MKLLDACFESCGDLQELFQPLSEGLVALQLSSGLLKGRVQAWGLDDFRLNLLTTYQDLFSNQIFDNSSSNWSYAHHTIQSVQDLNL